MDTDMEYTGDCINEIWFGTTQHNGHSTQYISFILPNTFGLTPPPIRYMEVGLENGEKYYTPYEIENFIYNYPYQIFVPRLDAILLGYNISSDANISIGESGSTKTVESSTLDDDAIYSTMPDSIDGAGRFTNICLTNPYSNKIYTYIAQPLLDDPCQIWQAYLAQSNIYEAYYENDYNPSNEVVVAVIDTGVDINHEDMQNSIWTNADEIMGNDIDDDIYGWTYRLEDAGSIIDPIDSHGTVVAGIIAAEQDNDKGGIGITENVKIMSLDVFSSTGIDMDYVYYAADNEADIINLSLGGTAYNSYRSKYDEAIEYAYKKGCLIVATAGNGNDNSLGNEGINLNNIPGSPICNDIDNDMVLGVTAVSRYDNKSDYANYRSDCVDISALGDEVFSTTWATEGTYELENYGTSFSAPI